jgi:nitroreductase
MIEELIKKARSVRRFKQDEEVTCETLRKLINLARLSPSAGNIQPLKYILSCEPEKNEKIFSTLAWAAYLKEWPGPREGEKPAAYIIITGDTELSKNFLCDHGIAAQSIVLGAQDKGLGACILGSIKRDKLREMFSIPAQYEMLLVIALGRPAEEVVIEEAKEGESIRYWRDEKSRHHVPKRKLEEIIIETYE